MLRPWPWVVCKGLNAIPREGLHRREAEEERSILDKEKATGHGGSWRDQELDRAPWADRQEKGHIPCNEDGKLLISSSPSTQNQGLEDFFSSQHGPSFQKLDQASWTCSRLDLHMFT